VDPHLNHLWASTCPQDVSWRPGAERTGGEQIDYGLPLPKAGFANTVDTVPMPAYPRLGQAEPVCNEAVTGSLTVGDSAHWGAVQGVLRVLGEDLETGNARRNAFASRAVLETHRYKYIEFTVDSVTSVEVGDTIRGTFHGQLTLVGATHPFSGPVIGWMQGDQLRIQAYFKMLAKDLIKKYDVSKYALGLGVAGGIWRWVFLGGDLLLTRVE
jgi:hypothetical protein